MSEELKSEMDIYTPLDQVCDAMKNIRKKIAAYERILRHAQEIESLPEEKEKV